jgi:NAD(P)H-dependent flavin oxidoreductase YrpB (nitropropane dioxygenase family)
VTRFTDLLGCRLPIQQAPMGGVASAPPLPVAVAAAGGTGMLSAVLQSPEALAATLDGLPPVPGGAIGVNFLVPFIEGSRRRRGGGGADAPADPVGETRLGPVTLPVPRWAVISPNAHTTGEIAAMALYAGQSVGTVDRVRPAGEVVAELAQGAQG